MRIEGQRQPTEINPHSAICDHGMSVPFRFCTACSSGEDHHGKIAERLKKNAQRATNRLPFCSVNSKHADCWTTGWCYGVVSLDELHTHNKTEVWVKLQDASKIIAASQCGCPEAL